MTAIVGVIQGSQALKMPVMQKFIVVTTLCNTAENRTPLRVSRTENDFLPQLLVAVDIVLFLAVPF